MKEYLTTDYNGFRLKHVPRGGKSINFLRITEPRVNTDVARKEALIRRMRPVI